jgi:dolichol-phosphate mannosyltransferase
LIVGRPVTSSPVTELTVVVPTYEERDNIEVLIERLRVALGGISWRVIVVDDDSPDGTADAVKRLAAFDDRVQCLRRVGRRGLSGAVIEGILASASPFVAVIDGDLQHDETRLPLLLGPLRSGADVAVGTRFASADGLATGLSPIRLIGSRTATWAAKRVLRADISDPVSGFFAVRREIVEQVAPRLSQRGFKILFDIIASQPGPPRIAETSYAFAERVAGVSKLDSRIVFDYAALLLAKATRDAVPARAILFAGIATIGVAGHLAVLAGLLSLGLGFVIAQSLAAATIVFAAFVVDAAIFGRGKTMRVGQLAGGAASAFVGGLANVAVADVAHGQGARWWAAGAAGAVMGAVWTYARRER